MTATARVVSPVFVGRTEDLATLVAAHEAAMVHGRAVVFVAGEAGIGKSRLISEFVGRLEPSMLVLTGSCLELGADGLPFAPFVAALRQLVRTRGTEWIANQLPGAIGSLALWLTEFGEPKQAVHHDALTGRTRLFEAILTVIEAAAEQQPVVFVLEDLHWADPSSRELLVFLVRNLSQPGAMLVGTYRSTELDSSGLRPLVAEFGRITHVQLLELYRFDSQDVGRQMAAILGREPDPALVARVHERSEGNPLFVEALTGAGETTPTTVRDLLLAGLAGLSTEARRVLAVAAVAGDQVKHELLVVVTRSDDVALEDAVRLLVDRQVLVPVPDGYVFRHALIRAAVYEDLLPGERVRLHVLCAEAIAAHPPLVPEGRAPADLATHWFAAGRHEQAMDAACRAAELACRSYAYEDQMLMLERVLQLWDSVADARDRLGVDHAAVLEQAAEACVGGGEAERGVELASAALTEIDHDREPERAARLLEIRALLKFRIDAGGSSDLQAALRLIPQGEHVVARGRALATLARGHALVSDHAQARPLAEQALEIGRGADDLTIQARALVTLAGSLARDGDLDVALGMFHQARSQARQVGDDETYLVAIAAEVDALNYHGACERAEGVARHGLVEATRLGMGRARGTVLAGHLAESLGRLGRWAEAREIINEALARGLPPASRAFLMFNLGVLDYLEGDRDAAEKAAAYVAAVADADSGNAVGDARADRFLLARHLLAGWLALGAHDLDAADQLLDRALDADYLAANPDDGWQLLLLGAVVQDDRLALARRDTHLRAHVASRREWLLALSGRLTALTPLQSARRAAFLAMINDANSATWDEVAAAWRTLQSPYQLAEALYLSARAALAAGDKAAAEVRLRESAAIAGDLGAVSLGRRIDVLARGARLTFEEANRSRTSRTDDGSLGLTRRELDVLRLVAKGHTNREIGEQLFISPSTAGVHVSHILAKLGVPTRVEAAAIAHRAGVVDD